MKDRAHEIGEALGILNSHLKPFVEREMRRVFGEQWLQQAARSRLPGASPDRWDTQSLLAVVCDQGTVFRDKLGPIGRALVSELRDVRNRWE